MGIYTYLGELCGSMDVPVNEALIFVLKEKLQETIRSLRQIEESAKLVTQYVVEPNPSILLKVIIERHHDIIKSIFKDLKELGVSMDEFLFHSHPYVRESAKIHVG